MHRFFIQQELALGELHIKSLQILHQLSRVLRIRPGEAVVFFNGDGFDYEAEILYYAKTNVGVRVSKKAQCHTELAAELILCHALIRKEKMELVFEKGTEIGISEFIPISTKRTIVKNIERERVRRIIKEAAEQSGRGRPPEVLEIMSFPDALDHVPQGTGMGVLFHPGRSTMPGISRNALLAEGAVHKAHFDTSGVNSLLAQLAPLRKKKNNKIYIFIGPEGGFMEDEVLLAKEKGIYICSILPTQLRAETAAIVFSGIVAAGIDSSL